MVVDGKWLPVVRYSLEPDKDRLVSNSASIGMQSVRHGKIWALHWTLTFMIFHETQMRRM